MAENSNIEQKMDNLFYGIFRGISGIFSSFSAGVYQLRKPMLLKIFAVTVIASLIILVTKYFLRVNEYAIIWYATAAALPVMDLFITGATYKQKQSSYQKTFADIGFKGKDGKTPRYIDSETKNERTTILFKSNIPLTAWNKNIEILQTGLDCKILHIKQGKSKKIVELLSVPTGHELPDFAPWKPEYMSDPEEELSTIVLGVSDSGTVKFDFNDIAHWIIAGAPGVGKSVLLRLIAYQCFLKGFKVYIMDFKRGMEFGKIYDHFGEVVMDKKRAAEILEELHKKCLRNADILREKGFKNIDEYNKANPNDLMERYVVIIDELASLLSPSQEKEDKEYTARCTYALEQEAILGRAPGVNLVLGIQRPDANTISGQIKTNVLGRISGFFVDAAASLIVLNNTKATELPSPDDIKGRYMIQQGQKTTEFQGYFLNDFKAMKKLLEERQATGQMQETDEPEPPPRAKKKPKRKKQQLEPQIDYDDCFDDAG